ncbi:YgfZ/GcvT domain-containing protein [Asticcacaulis tiandongensis]|uniref:CAF17-like 4Fe-4S cluster assembly/insertion protein YgfZ n=1 Tax=Asticcacaulis tiandongensis TaxID=2565365 RepID=UPI001FEC7698|nr:folate-binding protein [Asticcacaulis tiandongensis]
MTLIALPHRALIGFTGPDWAVFLNGQTSLNTESILQDVLNNTATPLYYGSILTPQGKLICDFFLHPLNAEEAWIEVPEALRDELYNRLNLYKLRAKIKLSKPDARAYAAIGDASGLLPDPRATAIGRTDLYRGYGDFTADTPLDTYIDYRLTYNLADPLADFPKEYLYPIDINLDVLGAIDFKKGCFVGQETTSRMKRRGTIKNRLLPLTHTHPSLPFGAEVLLGDRRAGEILASANGRSLALMRLDRMDGDLTAEGHAVTLSLPDWLKPVVTS